MAAITLQHVEKRFGAVQAVRDLSLEIRDREFFVLLGPTGAGKSTTLRCIAGLEQPDKGDICLGADRVNDWSAAQRDVALVFQQYSLYPTYTVRENLAFPLRSKLRKLAPPEIEARVLKAAETARISHLLDRRTDRLSGGEMQRVSIGRAIVREPRVFLMDEPLSNLDAKLRELLRAELKGLQQRLGTTLVFVTHDQTEAMTMADRIGLINKGQLVQVGTPHEIYNAPCNAFVASFVGTPAINLLEARIDMTQGRASIGALSFALTTAARERLAGVVPPDGGVLLGIRPEHVRLVSEGGMPGAVYGVENHGVEVIVVIDAGGQHLRATVPAKTALSLNQPVQIAFDQDKLHVFHPRSGESLFPRRVPNP